MASATTTAATTMTKDVILKVEHLSMRFGGLMAINDFSFEAYRGDITALIGPNGAGKTTVFNMLSGFLKPDSGSVKVRGADGTFISPGTPGDFAAIGVGRTFQIVQPFAPIA